MLLVFFAPLNVSAQKTGSAAFSFYFPSGSNAQWIDLSTQQAHKNAFTFAVNRINEINGVRVGSTNNLNNAHIISRSNFENVSWWGYRHGSSNRSTIEIHTTNTQAEGFTTGSYQ